MMARFTDWSLVIGVLTLQLVARSEDASTLLSAPKLPAYLWSASTDPKHQNVDYVLLKPGETRRVPLTKGVLVRLWSTALEPDKIKLFLQNRTRVELLKNGRAKIGNYYQKAFTLYPDKSTPAVASELKDGAALIVTNESKQENKWFYQAAVRGENTLMTTTKLVKVPDSTVADLISNPFQDKANWQHLDESLKAAAERGKKIFQLPANTKTLYQLCMASGSARSQKGQPIPILNVIGEGAFVGLVLDIRPAPDAHRRTFAFLEGNETITADGQKFEGTGTEDFFNSAWYFPDKSFAQKYHGMTLKSTEPPRVTAYRWMIPDAVPFKKNLKFEFEHGNGNNSNDLEYRWVAFWYQKPPFKFDVKDELKDGASHAAGTPAGTGNNDYSRAPIFAALLGALLVGGWALARRAKITRR